MAKNSIDAYGASGKTNLLKLDPDSVHIVTDEKHWLFDERAHDPVREWLVEDIMLQGQHTPIEIWKDPDSGKVCVVFGRSRVKALREANKRLRKAGSPPLDLLAKPYVGKADRLLLRIVSENEGRTEDTNMNRARKAQRLVEAGYGEDTIATVFHCSKAHVRGLIALTQCSTATQKAVEEGAIGVGEAVDLSKLPPDEQKSRIEQLRAEAPRSEKGRRKNARKAKEIVKGGPVMMGRREIKKMIEELEGEGYRDITANSRSVGAAFLKHVLGEKKALEVVP